MYALQYIQQNFNLGILIPTFWNILNYFPSLKYSKKKGRMLLKRRSEGQNFRNLLHILKMFHEGLNVKQLHYKSKVFCKCSICCWNLFYMHTETFKCSLNSRILSLYSLSWLMHFGYTTFRLPRWRQLTYINISLIIITLCVQLSTL